MEPVHQALGAGAIALPAAAAVLAALYLAALRRQRPGLRRWSGWRTASFLGGAALLALAVSPPLAHGGLRAHMVQHLLIGMLAPLALVLGAPATLALRTLPVPAARRLAALLRSRAAGGLGHPLTALLLNVGGMYLLYLTPLYAMTRASPLLHHLTMLHFLAAGYLFAWAVAGPDPAPRRPAMRTRLLALFVAMAAHATLAKLMYAYLFPRGAGHAAEEIRAAAQLMYYGGDAAELLLAVALFAAWYRAGTPRPRRAVATRPPAVLA